MTYLYAHTNKGSSIIIGSSFSFFSFSLHTFLQMAVISFYYLAVQPLVPDIHHYLSSLDTCIYRKNLSKQDNFKHITIGDLKTESNCCISTSDRLSRKIMVHFSCLAFSCFNSNSKFFSTKYSLLCQSKNISVH